MARPALAADRAIRVIDLLAAHPTERFTLSEIGRRTGINPASTHALLTVLMHGGFVQRHPRHKTFALGPAAVAAGIAALEQLPGIRQGQREIEELSRELDLEVVLTSPTEDGILVVGRASHAAAYGTALQVGQRLPFGPPLGTVFLAWSDHEHVDRWLARARPPLGPDETAVQLRMLEVVRSRGYAIGLETSARRGLGAALQDEGPPDVRSGTVDQLLAELAQEPYQLATVEEGRSYDVSMIAAPIFDSASEVTAAITVTGLPPGLPALDLVRIGQRTRGVGLVITKRTMGRVPDAS
jgi:DNA-binding IclR family transcriptional regulator